MEPLPPRPASAQRRGSERVIDPGEYRGTLAAIAHIDVADHERRGDATKSEADGFV